MASKNPVLIYDGDCGFCKQCIEWGLRNLTAFPAYLPSADPDARQLGLSQAELESQVWLVTSKKTYGGANAVSFLLRLQPNFFWRSCAWVILIALPISNLVYRWFAKNRSRLGPKNCELN